MDGRMGDLFKEIDKGDDTSFHRLDPLMLRLPIISFFLPIS